MSSLSKLVFALFALAPLSAFAADAKNWDAAGAAVFSTIANGGAGADSFVIDASTDKVHWVFQAQETCTADAVGFYYEGKTGTPVAHQIGIQGVATNGNGGDGTYLNSGNAKVAFTPDGTYSNNSWRKLTLGSTASLSRGVFYSLTMEPTGTPSGSHNFAVLYRVSNSTTPSEAYSVTVNGGSASKVNYYPIFAVYCGSTVLGYPGKGTVDHFWNNGTEERGIKFTIPSSLCSTVKLLGIGGFMRFGTGGTATLQLYNGGAAGDTTVLDDYSFDTDMVGNSGFSQPRRLLFDGTATTLTCGSTYRISGKPAAGISANMITLNVDTNSDLGAYHAGAINYFYTLRDGGNWTDTNTARPAVWPILEDLTVPSGSGGVKNQNQTSGGSQ